MIATVYIAILICDSDNAWQNGEDFLKESLENGGLYYNRVSVNGRMWTKHAGTIKRQMELLMVTSNGDKLLYNNTMTPHEIDATK